MRNTYLITGVFILLVSCTNRTIIKTNTPVSSDSLVKTVNIKTFDSLNMKADLYLIQDSTAPFIMLFHQARWSRGEYLEIAPKLNELGFNCIAVDQRSGDEINGIKNSTYSDAKSKGKPTEFEDAYQDLQVTLSYVKSTWNPTTVIAWGSSYTSALVIALASENPNDVNGVISFSPGEYFTINGKSITEHSKNINCPIFITSAKSEEAEWKVLFDAIPSKDKKSFLPKSEGKHGSSALWEKEPGNKEYWVAIKDFLRQFNKK